MSIFWSDLGSSTCQNSPTNYQFPVLLSEFQPILFLANMHCLLPNLSVMQYVTFSVFCVFYKLQWLFANRFSYSALDFWLQRRLWFGVLLLKCYICIRQLALLTEHLGIEWHALLQSCGSRTVIYEHCSSRTEFSLK